MAEKKKWENLSSDDEDTYERKPKPQVEETKPEQIEQPEEKTEQTHDEQPKKQYTGERRKLPDKGEMIDEIKKMETNVVSINIFRVEEKVTAKEIYGFFKDVKIAKIFKEQRPGQFTLDFDGHDNAIHFVKVAPRPMNGKKFMMRISNKKPKFDNADWNEIGMGGRLIRQIPRYERTGNKFQDKAPKHPEKNYNRKNVTDVYPEDSAEHSLPVKETVASQPQQEEEQQQEEQQQQQQQEKKPYYKKPYYKREEQSEGYEKKSFQKKGFYNASKGESKPEETKEESNDGFTTVPTKKDKQQKQQQPEQKPERKVQKTEDGWIQAGGEKTQQPRKAAPKKQVVQQEKPAEKEAPKSNKFKALEGW